MFRRNRDEDDNDDNRRSDQYGDDDRGESRRQYGRQNERQDYSGDRYGQRGDNDQRAYREEEDSYRSSGGRRQEEGYGRQQEQGYGTQQDQGYEQNYGRQEEQGYGRQEGRQQESYGRQQDHSNYGRQDEQGSRPLSQSQSQSGGRTGGGQYSRPSNKPQSFGVEGYEYQYSSCDGKKKALLIGINYTGTANQLNGCVNDSHNVREFLLSKGFSADNMVVLDDQQTNKRAVPTRQNILDAIGWLTKDAQPNDSLFFHYSGHGGQTPDKDGDEADGNDEVIYPLDFETAGFIDDDDLHRLLVNPLPKGARLTALFDSCHSGSVLDLPYMYSTKGVIKEPNLLEEAGSGLLETFKAYSQGNQKAVLSGIMGVAKSFINKDKMEKANEQTKQTKTSPADVITLSGCKDDQTSADAKENGKSTGAMSYSFLTVMKQNPNQSYLSLLKETREILANKYSQKPQLSSSHPIDTNLQFII
ncbi:putative cysteine protease [Scheffersomyces xylosifermentans]|uniref:putative cysteine protease n=1 Tax=Scheffersomyces xylosifermentans TaxID=1304137 RepID=UPI00315C7CA0